MNVLALDFGLKRVGVSVGSTDSGIAFLRPALENTSHLIDDVFQLMQKEDISHVLLGLPVKHDGSESEISEDLELFASELSERSDVSIQWINERFTTIMAQSKLDKLELKKSERKEALKSGERDSLAAQVMLEEWLSNCHP